MGCNRSDNLRIGITSVAMMSMDAQTIIAGAFAGGIVVSSLIVRLLDYPFEGQLALQQVDFSSLPTGG
jgi:hypothetical protein